MASKDFTKNVLRLMMGTTIAQAIPIAISPILTRLYTPEDFGVLGLFLAITAILGAIANGRYELAIILPEKDEDAINIAALGVLIATIISAICLVIVLLFNGCITTWLGNQAVGFWLYFAPIVIFMTGVFTVLNYLNTRLKLYKDIAKATVYKSVALAVVQLSVGFIKPGAGGLVSGIIISQFFANGKLFANISKKHLFKFISFDEMRRLGKRYKKFPIYSMWGGFLNTISLNMANIFISIFYSVSTLGYYTLVQRIFGLSSNIIAGSFSQVYFQEATNEKKKTGKAIVTFIHTLKRLVFIGLPIAVLLFLFVKPSVAIVFGKEWELTGVYAQILTPFFYCRFISSALSITTSVFEKQKTGLLINISLVLTMILLMGATYICDLEMHVFLFVISIVLSVEYLLFLLLYWKFVKGE